MAAKTDTDAQTTAPATFEYRKPKVINIYKTHYNLAYRANEAFYVAGIDQRLDEKTEAVTAFALIGRLKAMPVADTRPDDFDALAKLYADAGETAPTLGQMQEQHPKRASMWIEQQRLRDIIRRERRDAARERGAAAAAGILAALGVTVPSVEL